MEISVVIPTLNEAENLKIIIPRINDVLNEKKYEIIIVDGGSADNTHRTAAELGARVIEQKSKGFAGALKEGFKAARGEYVIQMDADMSHDPFYIPHLLKQKENADLVIASRYVKGGYMQASFIRRFLSYILNKFSSNFLNVPILDMSTGFRIYKKSSLDEIDITSKQFEVEQEIVIKLFNKGFKIIEIPFHYRPREKGVSKAKLVRYGIILLKSHLKLYQLRNSAGGADYDDRAFDSKIFLQRYWQRTRYKLTLGFVDLSKRRILDVGCGSSRIIQAIPQAIPVDYEMGKLRFLKNRRNRDVIRSSVFALPFKDEYFDIALFCEVIEHISPKEIIMKELSRCLKKGGILIIATPDFSRPSWLIIEWFYDRLLPYSYGHEHTTLYSMKRMRELLKLHSFRIEKYAYVGGSDLIVKARKRI